MAWPNERIVFLVAVCIFGFSAPSLAAAQTATSTDVGYVARAVVLQIASNTLAYDYSTTTPQTRHEIVSARISDGIEQGKIIKFSAYYTDGDGQNLAQGESMYVTRFLYPTTDPSLVLYDYSVLDHNRLPVVITFLVLFVCCIIYFGGKQGIRGLLSLTGGICLIVFLLLPGVLHGYSPLLLSIVVASFIASIGAYITHGFSKMTTAAVAGMVLTIILSAVLAEVAVHLGYLSGVTDEISYDLLVNPYQNIVINFQGLLLGGIIIGLLGVLYDAAIGQAVAVEELHRAGPHLPRAVIYERAYRVGKEHIGALVNTLVLAYVGASLPIMIMLLQSSSQNSGYMPPVLNWEFIATEVIRTTVGAMGLILTIPITTLIAVRMLVPNERKSNPRVPAA